MKRKEQLSLQQLNNILNILVWGTIFGGFLIWSFLPWNIPIYHKGSTYYNGSKFPLLILLLLPLFAFLQEKTDLETMKQDEELSPELLEVTQRAKRKGTEQKISVAIMEAIIILTFMMIILIIC